MIIERKSNKQEREMNNITGVMALKCVCEDNVRKHRRDEVE